MTTILATHLGDLAEALHDLRRRFRQAARLEVARAVGEALREASLAIICGPARFPARAPTGYSAWDDPWQDPATDPWHTPSAAAHPVDADDLDPQGSPRLPPAVIAGLAAARWGFVRTRQFGPAVLIGLLVALAASAGGPTVKALLDAWSAANDLLSYPDPDRRR